MTAQFLRSWFRLYGIRLDLPRSLQGMEAVEMLLLKTLTHLLNIYVKGPKCPQTTSFDPYMSVFRV